MNRLELIKRAILSVSSGVKNLLSKYYLSQIKTVGTTYETLSNGFSATTTIAAGGYGNYIHTLLLGTPEWGKTYTVTCNIQQSLQGMSSLMRVGHIQSGSYSWKDLSNKVISDSGEYSITFTLPDTPPDTFVEDLNWEWGGGFRIFFNVQLANLGECGTLTVTDIFVTKNE